MKAFFFHYSSLFALSNGWDMESDLGEFVEDNIEIFKATNSVRLKPDIQLTEYDIYVLSTESKETKVSNAAQKRLYEIACLEADTPEAILLTSMHSGSSDYLTIDKILKAGAPKC